MPTSASEKRRFEAYFPLGLDGSAYLSAWLADGRRVTAELDPRIARIVPILDDARRQDRDLHVKEARGWRSREFIARRIAETTRYEPDPRTVTAYVSELLKRLASTVQDAAPGETVVFIERRRGRGVRLAEGVELEISDGPSRNGECG